MKKYEGTSIFHGIAIGKVFIFSKQQCKVKREKIEDIQTEIKIYETAKKQAIEQLDILYKKAKEEVGEANAKIFEVHAMLLEDDDYNESVYNIIENEKVNAEFAVAKTCENFSAMFMEMEDEYFRARAADVKDISERMIVNITKSGNKMEAGNEPVIVVAKDLAPSETVQMDKEKMLGFVTEHGSVNSHTAILARTMNIPALSGLQVQGNWDGKLAILDGKKGYFYVEPDEETLAYYKKEKQKEEENKNLLSKLKNREDITKDGKTIRLYANIGSIADVASVLENDAAGIGLFRSEFIFLEKDAYPTEEEQFQIYKTVVQNMAGKKVIIRTLDIGADKKAAYFKLDHEENPALGYRAIRICLDRTEVFKTQLRAIYRASAFGNISIMFPMVISLEEVKKIKEICTEVKQELERNHVAFKDVELGIMIETPAAVMISDLLAKEVEFFSIGTNDLIQYTLAIDRQNPKLYNIYDAHHPALFRMIEMVIKNGHKENCWVGICGELGADTTKTKELVQMGIDELSVSPGMILPIRNIIINMHSDE